MTEAEWLAANEPSVLFDHCGTLATERKARLFGVACCTGVGGMLTKRGRKALLLAERLADEKVAEHEFHRIIGSLGLNSKYKSRSLAATAVHSACCPLDGVTFNLVAVKSVARCAALAVSFVHTGDFERSRHEQTIAELHQAALLRDIFGNPFRPVVFDPKWRSETAVALAAAIYEERAFDRLPILADALEEAGCDNADVLSHCRGDGPHARGCWVVDGVLGKE